MPDNDKFFLATKDQVDVIVTKVNDFDAKVSPVDLSSVTPLVLDFANDDITIIHGTPDLYNRIITN